MVQQNTAAVKFSNDLVINIDMFLQGKKRKPQIFQLKSSFSLLVLRCP